MKRRSFLALFAAMFAPKVKAAPRAIFVNYFPYHLREHSEPMMVAHAGRRVKVAAIKRRTALRLWMREHREEHDDMIEAAAVKQALGRAG